MTDSHEQLHEEIDRMTEMQVDCLKKFLASYPSPLAVACRNAPESDEPETEQEARLVAEAEEWLQQNGGSGIPHEEVMRELGLE